ncbi:MAG: lamin tail domain-containing protein, partial [Thermoplasmatales archaeon]|nr:lamin tail domain-containing protein [Thermoplasmatales archaeon]
MTNDVVAVIELVKNSYDAFARNVWVRFGHDPERGEYIEVEDDAFSRKQIMLNFTIKGASMHGKVSWDDGETVSNGTVLLKTDTKTFTENISSNGEYRFDDIAPATYKLWLNTSGHEFYVRDVIPVSDTDKTEDITLKGRVSGNLDYDENANVTNANVTVSLFDETNLTRMNVTSNESYSFEKILPGKYTLSVDEDNYLNFTGSFNLGLNEEKTVNVTLQSAVFISGTTYNTEPMKNVTLRFKGVMNTTVVSDETGFYKLKLIPGRYSISSTYIDNNAVYIFNDVLKVENLSITKNVSLKKGERTYGYVCYEKYVGNNTVNETSGENKTVNETLSNVHITFKSDNITVKTVSNSTGYYEVYLPKDNYTILVSYGYNETSTLVLLKPFNTTEKEQNITLIEGIKVYGILHYDLDETYDKTVAALILFESENGTVETTSDADGYYIVYLAVGNYNVSVNASDFILFSKETFVNKTIVTTIVNETTNETVNTTINEMWYNISLNPINITVSCVISSALLPEETINLTNVTVSFNASDDIGINNSVILNLTLNETTNQTYYNISLNPGNYNVTIEHNTNKSGTDVLYYNYTKLGIVVGEGNIKLNITVEKKIKINGTVWIDLNDNGKMDIINETNHIVINEICYNTSDPKAVWFELYNPTNSSVNITGWKIQFSSNTFTIPSWTIESGEYIIVCWDEDNFTSYWNVSNETKIIELGDWSLMSDLISIKNATTTIDMINDSLPLLPLNHSWSRYNGYDTGNFTDDFYDEINPTPGYENTKSKTEVIENATIEFITGNVSYTVQSDVNGTYEIYLKSGNYTVFVEYVLENMTHENETNLTYDNITYVYLNLTEFSVGNSTKDIQLVEAVNVSGFVYYDENDIYDADEGIRLNITFTLNTTNSTTNASRTATSNDIGYYQLYLPSGNYTVYVNETYGNANYTYNKSLPIPDSTYNISLEIDTIMVTGTVKYDDTPLGNVTISFNDFNTTTDESGLYKIYLPLDEYNVTITHPGFELFEETYNVSIISNHSINATLTPSDVPVYGVTYYDVNDNGIYDTGDILITNATISFTGNVNINVTSNGCYNTILPIGEYIVYANYVTPWNTSYGYFGQIPPIEPTPYQQLDIALIRSVKISGDIYYYNMTGENNTALVNITFIRDKGTSYEASKMIEGNGSYEIYLVPGRYTVSVSYTTFECNMNITYSYDKIIEVSESMRYDINITKVRKCKPGLHWNETEMQTINQGGSVSYNITVTNNGNDNDTFALSTLGVTNNGNPVEGWNVSFSKNSVTLGLNDNETVIVNITASPNALAYNNTITIKATSQNDTSAFDTTDLIVAVNRINDDINIECDEHEKWISPLESVDFVLSIENNGNNNENDLISLTVDPLPKGWNASLDNYRPFILGESKATVTLTVTAPSNAKLDDYTNIYLYATLKRNNTTVASNVLKAVVSFPDLTVKNITFSKSHPKIGESLTINATVCNLGNVNAFSSNGFEARFYVDDKLINTTYINQTTILVGENITMSADWNTTGVE